MGSRPTHPHPLCILCERPFGHSASPLHAGHQACRCARLAHLRPAADVARCWPAQSALCGADESAPIYHKNHGVDVRTKKAAVHQRSSLLFVAEIPTQELKALVCHSLDRGPNIRDGGHLTQLHPIENCRLAGIVEAQHDDALPSTKQRIAPALASGDDGGCRGHQHIHVEDPCALATVT
eukprot:479600-Prymnesium_polylepis.1